MSINEVKEIKEITEKINSQAKQQSDYTDQCHDKSLNNHEVSENALLDLADTIGEMADYIIQIDERVTALEGKEA